MQKVNRLILVSLLTAVATSGAWAVENAPPGARPPVEYKRADTNFYPKAGLLKANPTIVIIPKTGLNQNGDSYFFTPKIRAPKNIYVETLTDWVEPITPPGATSLGIAPDAMQIREPQGDVEVALPSAPANFLPVTDGMTLPNGAVVKTGADGTAAVLFGGVDSARLMPNSAAAVQQTVTAQSRSVEVDLTTGGVFSKVGTQVGVQGDYEVHTPDGNASTQGGDFVTLNYEAQRPHTDVWVAQGTIDLVQSDGTKVGQVSSDGTGPLPVLRTVSESNPANSLALGVQELTEILNFIPMANQKIKALRDKMANGGTLNADEQAYLNRIKQVPSLIKLALVKPAAPVAVAPPVVNVPAPPSPANPKPINVVVHTDGTVRFQGARMGLTELQSKLETIIKATPDQAIVIKAGKTVPYEKLKEVLDICATVGVKNVSIAVPASAPPTQPTPSAPPAIASPPAVSVAPAAPVAITPAMPAPAPTPAAPPTPPAPAEPAPVSTPAPTPIVNVAPANPPAAPAPKPLRAIVRVDGKVNFQGATYELPAFKLKLEALMKATPNQPILLKAGKTVPYEEFQDALDVCNSVPVKNLTTLAPPPSSTPANTTESPTTNLPAPGLLMHPSMEPTSPAPSETPTTHAPPPAGP